MSQVGFLLSCFICLYFAFSVHALTASYYHQMLSLYPQNGWQGDLPPGYTVDKNYSQYDLKHMLQAWLFMKIKSHDHRKVLILGGLSDEIFANTIVNSVQDDVKAHPIVDLRFGIQKGGNFASLCPSEILPPQSSNIASCNAATGTISILANNTSYLYEDEVLRWIAHNVSVIVINETLSNFASDKFTHFIDTILSFRSALAPAITIMSFMSYSRLVTSELYQWVHHAQSTRPITEVILNTHLARKLHPNITTIIHSEEVMYSLDILPAPRVVMITPVSRWRNLDLVRASIQFSHISTWVIIYSMNSTHSSPPPMLQARHYPTKIIELQYDYNSQNYSNAGNGERNMGLRYLYNNYLSVHGSSMKLHGNVSRYDDRVHSVCHELVHATPHHKNMLQHELKHCQATLPHDQWTVFLDDDNVIHRNFWQLYMTKALPELLFTGKVMHTNLHSMMHPLQCKVYWLDSAQMISSLYLLHRSHEHWHLWHHQADGMYYEAVCKHYPDRLRKVDVVGCYHNALLVPHVSLEEDL